MENKEEKTGQKTLPPYIPFKTFSNFIESLQQGIPSRIDRSLMSTMSGSVQIQLITTLKYLGLITKKGLPTETLPRLVNSEGLERKQVIREILKSSYSYLFIAGFQIENITAHQFEDKFKEIGAGGQTLRKCINFFIEAAKVAELTISPYIGKANRSSGKIKIKRSLPKQPVQRYEEEMSPAPIQPKQIGWTQLLLSKFPSFDPSWSDEIKAKWFDAFDKLMKRGLETEEIKVKEANIERQEEANS